MPTRMRARWHWLFFGLLALAEFLFFDRMVSRHHAWVYPRWNDQIQYLTESYTGYEYLRTHGFRAGLWQTLINPSAQGTLHDFFAVLVFCLVGPSRSAALSLNMLAFIAWQGATFASWRWLTGRWSPAWLGAGLLLCLHSLVAVGQGSPVDFRLDWFACCAVGVVSCVGLRTGGMRHTGWSALWGLTIGVAILTRFLTVAYFGVIFLLLLLWLIGRLMVFRDHETGSRLGRLLLAGAVAAAVAGPLLWENRVWVINYYWIGHLTGPESALRSAHFGIGRSLSFIFKDALWLHHAGTFFGWVAGAGAVALGVGAWFGRQQQADAEQSRSLGHAAGLGVLLLFVPALILTLHSQKSLYVVGILLPGLVTLLLTSAAACMRRAESAPAGWSRTLPSAVASGVLLVGIGYFAWSYGRNPYPREFEESARKVNTLADYLYHTARAEGLSAPRLGVDQVTDCLDAQIMRVICYERHRDWVPFMMTLPTGIAEEKEPVLRQRLEQSDFILLTDEPGIEGFWPYDRQMRRLYPQFHAWCESHLQRVESFRLFGRAMTLYRRPPSSRG